MYRYDLDAGSGWASGNNLVDGCNLHPIVTLRADLSYSGAGAQANPWVIDNS